MLIYLQNAFGENWNFHDESNDDLALYHRTRRYLGDDDNDGLAVVVST